MENLQRYGAYRAGLRRVRSGHLRVGIPPQENAHAYAHGFADKLSRLRMWPASARNRRRAPLEFLLDRLPLEVEHAFAARRSCDLHVDLRHDPPGNRECSAGPRTALVFRFASAAWSGEDRESAPLFFSLDHCRRLSVAGNAPILSRSLDAASWRTSPSPLADCPPPRSLPRRCDFHVLRMCCRHHHAVLPCVEAGDGYG